MTLSQMEGLLGSQFEVCKQESALHVLYVQL